MTLSRKPLCFVSGEFIGVFIIIWLKLVLPLIPANRHGLSYTEFEIDQLAISGNHVSFSVTNTGSRSGATVAQVYISTQSSTVPRAPRSLIAFEKTNLAPRERRSVTAVVDKYATSYWDEGESVWRDEAGEYEIHVGFSSRDIRLKGVYRVDKCSVWLGL